VIDVCGAGYMSGGLAQGGNLYAETPTSSTACDSPTLARATPTALWCRLRGRPPTPAPTPDLPQALVPEVRAVGRRLHEISNRVRSGQPYASNARDRHRDGSDGGKVMADGGVNYGPCEARVMRARRCDTDARGVLPAIFKRAGFVDRGLCRCSKHSRKLSGCRSRRVYTRRLESRQDGGG